jgi:hypothetical protein
LRTATKTEAVDKLEATKTAPVHDVEVMEWFTVRRYGDNDYRIVKQLAPLLVTATPGPRMTLPAEVWDRWQIDAEEMLSRNIKDW